MAALLYNGAMIITKQKPAGEILEALRGAKSVFMLGCGDCSTLCKTGGQREIDAMAEKLNENSVSVTGSDVVPAACHELDTQRILRKNKQAVASAEILLVLTCGAGVQAVGDYLEKAVVSGCDSLFIGNSKRQMHYYEKCSACGDCVLNSTAGLCPITRCSKELLNSPCGGARNGKCEVNEENECVWIKIYERMKKFGRLDDFMKITPPKDYSASQKPRRLEQPRQR